MTLKTLLSLLDQVSVSATGFLSTVIMARYCSLDELGLYHLVVTLLLILRGIQAELVTSPYTVYNFSYSGEQHRLYTGSSTLHQLLVTLFALILLGMLGLGLNRTGYFPDLFALLPMLLLATPPVLLREFCKLMSYARLQLMPSLLMNSTILIFQTGGLLVLASFAHLSTFSGLAVIGGACSLGILLWWQIGSFSFVVSRKRVAKDWWHNWKFSRWTLASFFLGNFTPYILPWMIAWFLSEAETGIYSSCVLLIGLTNLITTALANVITPHSAEILRTRGAGPLLRVGFQGALFLATILGGITLLISFIGDWLGEFVYGVNFAGVGLLCTLLAAARLLESLSVVASKLIWVMDQPAWNLPADLATTFTTLGLGLALIPDQGIIGAAVAVMVGHGLGASARWIIAVRINCRIRAGHKAQEPSITKAGEGS